MASLFIERKYVLNDEIYMFYKSLCIFIFMMGYHSGDIKYL